MRFQKAVFALAAACLLESGAAHAYNCDDFSVPIPMDGTAEIGLGSYARYRVPVAPQQAVDVPVVYRCSSQSNPGILGYSMAQIAPYDYNRYNCLETIKQGMDKLSIQIVDPVSGLEIDYAACGISRLAYGTVYNAQTLRFYAPIVSENVRGILRIRNSGSGGKPINALIYQQ